MDTSSNLKEEKMTTTMRKSFDSPIKMANPNFRAREKSMFDPTMKVEEVEHRNRRQNSSGFTMNSTLFDGTGWQPEKNLHTDQMRTIYRNQFN